VKAAGIILGIACYNEGPKIGEVLRRVPHDIISEVVVVDDGSTDETREVVKSYGATLLHHPPPRGVGSCILQMLDYARQQGAQVITFVAGNNKDYPEELPRVIRPILEEGFDLVQGSRYLSGGRHGGQMPWYRIISTKLIHPSLFALATGRRLTDTTNGYRAIRLCILDHPQIDPAQPWLRRYELEPYLLYKAVTLGFRVGEVPVTKLYPPKQLGYTKMRPVVDWWSILKPLVVLPLGLKH
jgi:dolichol-phosphate mannosyltransferase